MSLVARQEISSIDVGVFLAYTIAGRPEPNLLNLINNPGYLDSQLSTKGWQKISWRWKLWGW